MSCVNKIHFENVMYVFEILEAILNNYAAVENWNFCIQREQFYFIINDSFFDISDFVPIGECVTCDSSVDSNCVQAPGNIEPQKCSDPADSCYSRIVSKYRFDCLLSLLNVWQMYDIITLCHMTHLRFFRSDYLSRLFQRTGSRDSKKMPEWYNARPTMSRLWKCERS